ncbi:MAG: alpha-E domain-containing protein [Rhodospirillaceae bacterium]|nr:alpha-E domain-containing protein [Rhodospirillaceae bacterium]MDD9915955.1 alpha-E domain-containing protein [Rhodospirillaceae bacterium]MDD9927875.1 alpha-E domain-containing protein [Rhodospirillaceae bacterium]
MLGKTAGGLFWMFRYLERSENTVRLLDAGFRIALTRSSASRNEWESIVTTAGVQAAFAERHDEYNSENVIDFLLRDKSNASSVVSVINTARNNARLVRTALTREVWEATNDCWLTLQKTLARPVREKGLPDVLASIRQHSALVRGALHGTMLRNEIYDFARLGTFIERADNTARILDVKYYLLLPSVSLVGSRMDNAQWETILRSVSANHAYRWLNGGDINPTGITEFLILDRRMPRSLAFCYAKIMDNLGYLATDYGEEHECHQQAAAVQSKLDGSTVASILEEGLHEFLGDFIRYNNRLGALIEQDYRFCD